MTKPCVQCGYCCTQAPCIFGACDENSHRCKFLTPENKCAKYAEIVEKQKDAYYPMFGCGCSSSLCNTMREQKIKSMEKKNANTK